MNKPSQKPICSHFSSGPTRKRPGWQLNHLSTSLLGRSHRSKEGLERIRYLLQLMKEFLNLPVDYQIGIIPGSTTGAMECALWSFLGHRPVDIFAYDVFSQLWLTDCSKQLKIKDYHFFEAPFGELPDFYQHHQDHDCIITWNGTTAGVCIPDADWISPSRAGLVLCDATSAVFCKVLPWEKLDVVAFSWQKALGGEAAHGVLVLSPKAIKHLNSYSPSWPIPKLFQLTLNNVFNLSIFEGCTINTPSWLCIEDCLDTLLWAKSSGGLTVFLNRTEHNISLIKNWVFKTPWARFLAKDLTTLSSSSPCLILEHLETWEKIQKLTTILSQEGVAYDIKNHQKSYPSLRIWTGPMIEHGDIELLLPWLEWGYSQVI